MSNRIARHFGTLANLENMLDRRQRAEAWAVGHAIACRLLPPLPWPEGSVTEAQADAAMAEVVRVIGTERAGKLVDDLLAADDI
jgi:hypothetical protein